MIQCFSHHGYQHTSLLLRTQTVLFEMEKGEKGEKQDDEKGDTRPRRPRRLRKEESSAGDEEDNAAASKADTRERDAPQSKPRRKRNTADEETAGDGGWMGGIAQEQKPKFEPEPEGPVIVA